MVKTLVDNSTYEPTRRSLNWLKLKQDYIDGLADSFDLVPIAAYLGKGKRTGVYGAYLLATYSEDDEEFQAITKVRPCLCLATPAATAVAAHACGCCHAPPYP